MKLKIAVPSKGRISDPSISILEKAGLGLKDNANRKLISATFNKDIDVIDVYKRQILGKLEEMKTE